MKARDSIDFLLLAAIWGSSFLFMKLAGPEFGVFPSMALRTGLAALILLPLVLTRGLFGHLREHGLKVLGVGLLNSGLPFALFAFATLYLSAGFTSILNSTVPFWGALIAWLWLGDRPKLIQLLGLVVGFLGVTLLVWGTIDFKPGGVGWPILACLAATLCYGLAANLTKKILVGVNPMVSAAGSQIGAALLLVPLALVNLPRKNPGALAWLSVLMLAVLCTALAYILYFRLMRNLGPMRATSVTFLIPVFGMLWGALFLGESVSFQMALASAVILLGTAMTTGALRLGKH
jgi:drug/metabolite transporter (DMT)-like permease